MFQRTKDGWRQASPRSKVLLVGSAVVIFILLAAVVWSVFRSLNEEPPVYEPLTNSLEVDDSLEALVPDANALPAPKSLNRAVLERHFAAIGGVKRLTSINSLLVSADIDLTDGESMSFVIAKKKGERIRLSYKRQNVTITMVVTPEDAWRSVRRDGKPIQVEDLALKEQDNLRRSSYVVSELFLAMNNSWTTEYLGQQAFNYQMAYCYEVKVNPRHIVRFFIDPDTFLDIGREERTFEEDGTLTVSRSINSDHMDISGLKVPAMIETYVNDKLTQTLVVRDVELNPGILDSTFIRPDLPPSPEE
ncbi:hypothetical protein G0Q06_13325 [Puniceicoccales bacterium CK1056]|uniref:DUF4292 domain-containing protein n=1 Tax=Oceanipulchritudo coccoides TaxID=2706888 RepID=A0A6B2M729_9BACT|nr:hypothetical protein [Oceanipulchritudo coccoides]NDV63440.1 hypothetical protein [Oceanipulchritudo coccoides]